MKTLFVFLCLALAFTSCTKDNPVAPKDDINDYYYYGYSELQIDVKGIKVLEPNANDNKLGYELLIRDAYHGGDYWSISEIPVNVNDKYLPINHKSIFKVPLEMLHFKPITFEVTAKVPSFGGLQAIFEKELEVELKSFQLDSIYSLNGVNGLSKILINHPVVGKYELYYKLTTVSHVEKN